MTAARIDARDLPQGTYVELVASLCGTRTPAAIMTSLFVTVGGLTVRASHDPGLLILVLVGALASVARLSVLIRGRRRCDGAGMSPAAAQRFERSFAITYLVFAGVFGLFAARVVVLPLPECRMPIGILVVGFAAGAASTIAMRPRIVVSSLFLSVTPPSIALLLRADAGAAVSAACLMALLAGGLRSVGQSYRSQAVKTTKRQRFAHLARTDHLTGLGNRLALAEAFDELDGSPMRSGIAVHYIDLDDFKPVNDRLGHQAGDTVLRMVADRLRSCRSDQDVVVRLGGDEFVLVQSDAATEAAVADCASRLERALNDPYDLHGSLVFVGASVGSSRYPIRGGGIDFLLAAADDALRSRKTLRKASRSDASIAEETTPLRDLAHLA